MEADAPPKSVVETEKEKATALYKEGSYSAAVAAYTRAIAALSGEDAAGGAGAPPPAALVSSLYGNRAAALVMLKRWDDAADDCARALAAEPDSAKLLMRKAKCDLACGAPEEALAALGAVLAGDPTNAAARTERASAQRVAARFAEVREAAAAEPPGSRAAEVADATGKLLEVCVASVPIKMLRGAALMQLGRLGEALSLTTELMQQLSGGGPALAAALLLRAQVLNRQGHGGSAVKLLAEALRGDPDDAVAAKLMRLIKKGEALKEQGNVAFKAGKWDAAAAAYSEALTLDPSNNVFNSKLLCNRATALAKAGKTAEAIADYTASIAADEGYAKAYLRRAVALQALGDADSLQEAVRDLSKAKELLGGGAGGGGSGGGGGSSSGGGAVDENAQVLRDVEVELKKARVALKKAKKKDYYKLLELERNADDFEEALKRAYRKAALKWHPDRHSTGTEAEKKRAEAMFKDVTEANTVLSDPQNKARYDASLDGAGDFDPSGGDGGGGGGGGFSGSQQDMCVG
jgi:DnaJ family protein C protein 7